MPFSAIIIFFSRTPECPGSYPWVTRTPGWESLCSDHRLITNHLKLSTRGRPWSDSFTCWFCCSNAMNNPVNNMTNNSSGTTGVNSSEQPDPDFIKMFVGQIPRSMDENDLRKMFEEFGRVHQINVLRDKVTGQSKGRESSSCTYR